MNRFAVLENMRHLLKSCDTWSPIQLGYQYKYHESIVKEFGRRGKSFVTGGPGYILSKEALRRFATMAPMVPKSESVKSKFLCYSQHDGPEDLFLGRNKLSILIMESLKTCKSLGNCLEKMKVSVIDTRDGQGRERFIPHPLEKHLMTSKTDLSEWAFYPVKQVLYQRCQSIIRLIA